MSWPDCPPLKWEIEEQLTRILSSRRFRNASNPSAFLEFVVGRALEDKRTAGHLIAEKLFAGKFVKLVSNDVRQTKANLCKTLERYYKAEGKDDMVVIYLPDVPEDTSIKLLEGEAYTPQFKYNPKLDTVLILRMGYRLLEYSTYRDYVLAFSAFSEVLEKAPNHCGATIGLVETFCKFADRHWNNPAQLDPLSTCNLLLGGMPAEMKNYWRYWAANAFVEKVVGEDTLAAAAFRKALELDQSQTESYIPYISFMFETQQTDIALGLADRYIQAHMEDSVAHTQYAYFMALALKSDVASSSLETALLLDAGNRGAHEFSAIIAFLKKDSDRFTEHMRTLRAICDATSFALIVAHFEKYEPHHSLAGWTAKALESTADSASDGTAIRRIPPLATESTARAKRPSLPRRALR